MGLLGYRYGVGFGVCGVTLWGCGGDTGVWDPLITDMGWILGSVGSGGKKGPWDPLFTDMGWVLGSVGYECNTGDVGPPGHRYGVGFGSMGCGGKKGPWDPLVTDMGWDLGSWLGSVGCGINKGL